MFTNNNCWDRGEDIEDTELISLAKGGGGGGGV